jgi:hypothetical protein
MEQFLSGKRTMRVNGIRRPNKLILHEIGTVSSFTIVMDFRAQQDENPFLNAHAISEG